MKKMKRLLLSTTVALTAVVAGSATAALAGYDQNLFIAPKTTYDSIVKTANNYSYLAAATSNYNCLAYALGNTSSWVWPWGGSEPTSSQVDTYLSGKGYTTTNTGSSNDTKIISYGTTSAIKHFGKPSDNNFVNSKWGHLERLQSLNWNPYSSVYGERVKDYKLK